MQQEEKRLILEFMELVENMIKYSSALSIKYQEDAIEKIIEEFEKTGK